MPCQFAGTLESSEVEASAGHGYDSGLRPRVRCRGAMPAPRPTALKPSAPTIAAPAAIFFKYIAKLPSPTRVRLQR